MSEYRMTGLDCSGLNDTAVCVGYRNVAGGSVLTFSAYDPVRRALTIADGNAGKCGIGTELFLWTTANDSNSPYRLKIVKVDVAASQLILSSDPAFGETVLAEISGWIGTVRDIKRTEAAFASGELCFSTGDFSFASGSLCLASGFGAHAEGILCEARGEMSFSVGNMTKATGLAAFASGTDTEACGMFSHAEGSSTKATGDNSHAEGAGCEASGDTAHAGGFRTKAAGRLSFAHGSLAEANGDYSFAVGRQIVNNAVGAALFGTHGTLDAAAENTGAFALAGGTLKEKRVPLIIRTNKAVKNPLYPQEGEKEYLPEPEFSAEYAGHLLARTETVTGSVLEMDHGTAGRWKFTPTGQTVPQLKNWLDGDTGELIIFNGGSKIAFPAEWNWIGTQPGLKTTGFDLFTIRKIDNTIFIRHEVSA